MREAPSPGTQAAIDAGCTCPVMDNCRGRGYHGQAGVYVYNSRCPVHADQIRKLMEAKYD